MGEAGEHQSEDADRRRRRPPEEGETGDGGRRAGGEEPVGFEAGPDGAEQQP